MVLSVQYIGRDDGLHSIKSGIAFGEIGKSLVFELESKRNPEKLQIKYILLEDPAKGKNEYILHPLKDNELLIQSFNLEKGLAHVFDSPVEIISSIGKDKTYTLFVMFEAKLAKNNKYKLFYEFFEKESNSGEKS